MPIITLTSDWGIKDHYIGAVKGKIISLLPDATIIDISHEVPSFNIREGAYIIRNAFRQFPDGTVHIIGINTEESEQEPHVAVYADKHYFVGCDNGLFALLFDKPPESIIELTITQDSDYFTFSTRDRFVKAAIHLAAGKNIQELGTGREKLQEKILFNPVVEENVIKGMVIYVDNYENVITNISKELFNKVRKGRKFKVVLRGDEIKKLSESYSEAPVGEVVVLFGSNDLLQIAINKGNASGLLGLKPDDMVRVEFD